MSETSIRLEAGLEQGLVKFIDHRDEPPRGRMTADDAVNVIVRDWLESQGYLPLPSDAGAVVKALDAAKVP